MNRQVLYQNAPHQWGAFFFVFISRPLWQAFRALTLHPNRP